VLGGFGIELVERDLRFSDEEAKLIGINNQMKKSLLRADRTIAIDHLLLRKISRDCKSHLSAMTSTLIGWHKHSSSYQLLA